MPNSGANSYSSNEQTCAVGWSKQGGPNSTAIGRLVDGDRCNQIIGCLVNGSLMLHDTR